LLEYRIQLEDKEYWGNTDRALDGRPPGAVTGALVMGSMFGSVEMNALEGKQMRLLREWILELGHRQLGRAYRALYGGASWSLRPRRRKASADATPSLKAPAL